MLETISCSEKNDFKTRNRYKFAIILLQNSELNRFSNGIKKKKKKELNQKEQTIVKKCFGYRIRISATFYRKALICRNCFGLLPHTGDAGS